MKKRAIRPEYVVRPGRPVTHDPRPLRQDVLLWPTGRDKRYAKAAAKVSEHKTYGAFLADAVRRIAVMDGLHVATEQRLARAERGGS